MISVIIATKEEPLTIGKSIELIASQEIGKKEIIIIAADKETFDAAKKLTKKFSYLKVFREKLKGKPNALNQAVTKAKGKILILTDGDVFVGKDSLSELLKPFKDKKVGAVSGRPVSIDSKKTKFGFWSHMLTETAHKRRLKAAQNKKRFFCTGYLFAIRADLFPKLPGELLSEDGFISHKVYEKRFKIAYTPKAEVFVKFPQNFQDWISQKRRGIGGYNQMEKIHNKKIRSFKQESSGFLNFFSFVSNPKEFFWVFELFLARIYVWLLIYKDVNIKKKSREELWKPVKSTK